MRAERGVMSMTRSEMVFDAGHGGRDRSNRGPMGYVEADGTLAMAQAARGKLAAVGVNAALTRETDVDLCPGAYDQGADIQGRADVATGLQLPLISIHTNAASSAAQGTETYVQRNNPASHALGMAVHAAVVKALGTADRGVRVRDYDTNNIYKLDSAPAFATDYYGINRRTKQPAIIVEVMFHSNLDEETRLKDPAILQLAGEAIADGVIAYLGVQTGTPIMGKAKASATQARAWLKGKGVDPILADQMSEAVWGIAPRYRLRPEVVLAQMCKETGYFRYGGLVGAWQNNFGGIGATGRAATGEEPMNGADPLRVRYQAGVHGVIAVDLPTGVEVNCQHLYAYATAEDLPADRVLLDPRFRLVRRGTAPITEHLGAADNPVGIGWAYPGKGYGHSIVSDYLVPLLATAVDDGDQLRDQILRLERENAELRIKQGEMEAKITRAREALS